MRKKFFFQMEVKAEGVSQSDANGKRVVTIEGFASTPDLDRYKDIVLPEAFASALQMFMKNPVLLRSHDPDRPAGTVKSATVTDGGLKIVAEVNDEKTQEEILDGRMRALSIGYIPIETELQHADGTPFNFETDSVWDPEIVRVIKTLDLVEISIVSTPANGNALFTVAKSVAAYFKTVTVKGLGIKVKGAEGEGGEEKPKEEVQTAGEAKAEGAEGTGEAPVKTETNEPAPATAEPAEEAEKPAETAGADGGEGAAKAVTEAPKAEAEPTAGVEGADGGKQIVADAKTIELVGAIFMAMKKAPPAMVEKAEAKEGAFELPESVKDALNYLATLAAEQYARAEELASKRVLSVQGQFEAPKGEEEKAKPSDGFIMNLIKNARS